MKKFDDLPPFAQKIIEKRRSVMLGMIQSAQENGEYVRTLKGSCIYHCIHLLRNSGVFLVKKDKSTHRNMMNVSLDDAMIRLDHIIENEIQQQAHYYEKSKAIMSDVRNRKTGEIKSESKSKQTDLDPTTGGFRRVSITDKRHWGHSPIHAETRLGSSVLGEFNLSI